LSILKFIKLKVQFNLTSMTRGNPPEVRENVKIGSQTLLYSNIW